MWVPRRPLIERIHDHLLAKLGGETGPLNPQLLEASIARSKTFVFGIEPFKGPVSKAIALGYGIISWHPFYDGNKRTGLFTMLSMLEANGMNMAFPPYVVKYCVQAALPPENKHHISEAQFAKKVSALCYAQNSRWAGWKEFRYNKWPNFLLQQYIKLAERFPKSLAFQNMLGRMVFDWYAAEDEETMRRTLVEWEISQAQGYPKDIPPLEIQMEDFEEFGLPDDSLQPQQERESANK
jgi:prophage maintenance system killer protein